MNMTCREFVELVTDYLDGALSPADLERFEHHLALCPGCDTYLEQIRRTVSEVGRVEEEDLSADARTRLLGAFRDWHRSATP